MPAPEQGHLASCALPPHSSPLSQACSLVGAPPPPLALEWGRLRPHPIGGCCQDSMHACAQVNVALEGDRLTSLSPGSGKPLGSRYTHLPSCAATWEALCGPAVPPVGEVAVGWRGLCVLVGVALDASIRRKRWPRGNILRAHTCMPLPLAIGRV